MRRFDDVARKPALGGDFPSFLEGLSLRPREHCAGHGAGSRFLRLRAGTFIEAPPLPQSNARSLCDFPSFSEGLSTRQINIAQDDRETVCSVP